MKSKTAIASIFFALAVALALAMPGSPLTTAAVAAEPER